MAYYIFYAWPNLFASTRCNL